MSNIPALAEIEYRAQRLLELLDNIRLSGLDFDSREHLHVIGLCLDTALAHVEKIQKGPETKGE
ncbi:MAG: hypothetical protein A4E28_01250 [Methanocella sp. PtaU1.Bin125]|nr:MAG: hypothetical protein A4E28_01250 [Methanocella sp. PtaU1.Bin125]